MKKYFLSATVLTFLISTSALADVTQSYQECRQAEGRLGWFLVTYTVYPQPAPTGHRIPTAVEDMKQACTAADYEQSRQAGAMWGESWPALQAQPAEVTPSVRQAPANTPASPVTDPAAATASQGAAPVIKPRQSSTVMANKDSGGGRNQEIPAKAPQQAAPAIKTRHVDRSPTSGELGDPSIGSGNRAPQNGPDLFTPTPKNTSLGGQNPGNFGGQAGPVDVSPKRSDVRAAPTVRRSDVRGGAATHRANKPRHNGGQGRAKEPSGSFQKPANEQPVQRSMHRDGSGKSRQYLGAKASPPMNSSQLGNGSRFGTNSHFAGNNRFGGSAGNSNFGGNSRLVVRRLGPRFGGGMGYMHGPNVRPTFR